MAQSGVAYYANFDQTACAQSFTDNDYVAGIAISYWSKNVSPNNDPVCKRRVRVISLINLRTVDVATKDRCSHCDRGDIVLSPIAFQRLATLGVASTPIYWNWL